LELARFDAGQEPMARSHFDLSHGAQQAVELVRPLAKQRGVKIECELPAVTCAGDAERISQVTTNLLTNAVQFNRADGTVRVTCVRRDLHAVLEVTDTGVGIAPEDLPHIFERFYRADRARSSGLGRTGLGLSICKAIVEAHSGTIEVHSEPGVGTTFTLRLPAD
jgi:signal transduction histidine kinase